MKKEEKIRILCLQMSQEGGAFSFEEKTIANELENLQSEVNGMIEMPYYSLLGDHGIDIVINEEGKYMCADDPRMAIIYNGEISDIIFGPLFFCSSDEEGNLVSLTDEQISYLKETIESCTVLICSEIKELACLTEGE